MVISILYSIAVLLAIWAAYYFLGYREKKRAWKKKVETWYDTTGERNSFIIVWGDKFDRTKHAEKVRKKLLKANLGLAPSEFYGMLLLGVIAVTIFLSSFIDIGFPVNLIIAVAIVEFSRRMLFFLRRNKYQEQMNGQLPEICRLLANGTRSGMTLAQSFQLAANDLDDPAKEEFDRLSQELQLGVSFDSALAELQERVSSKDFKLFVATLLIQKRVGGDLHTVLDEMAQTFEDRNVLAHEIQTMTAEQRYISILVPIMPIFLVLIINSVMDGFIDPLFHGVGLILLGLFLTGTVLTFLLVRKVMNIRV